MNIIFQQEPDESLRKPWPVVVDEKNSVVSGRPDATSVLGFSTVEDPMFVALFIEDARNEPSKAVGMLPVFIGKPSGIFTIDLPITECRQYDGDIEKLREYGA